MTVQVIDQLMGQTVRSIENVDQCELIFHLVDGRTATFYHEQQCCEIVCIEDIIGDLQDLIGSEILQAESVTEEGDADNDDCQLSSSTWTFYKFATVRGSVTVRWYGTSNGYYSESVDFRMS